jgi:hypothetical protein
MKYLLCLLLFSGCASTTVYGPNGKPRLKTQADLTNVRLTSTTFTADLVNHSATNKIMGDNFSAGAAAVGAGIATSGILSIVK